jgi:glucose/arabinose dehydrogenase
MPSISIRRASAFSAIAVLLSIMAGAAPAGRAPVPCDADNAGLTLPPGFCATRFVENLGAPRHMVVSPNGDVLVIGNPYNTGAEAGGAREGGALTLLRDADGDGKAEVIKKLAPGSGSGIALANGYLYSSSGPNIVRYKYATGQMELGAPDTIITEIATGGHSAYNFVIVGTTLYMNVGSRTNSCQATDRELHVPGVDPCVELETRAGVWTFDANKIGQKPADGTRFATGIRNSVSLTVDPRDRTLWATMHGRDQLGGGPAAQAAWDFSAEYNAENPAEQTNHILKGDDFGWPYCYFSNEEHKLVTAPEYGGDGKKSDRCVGKKVPAYAFPGHWAPNDMLFYTGAQYPAEYRAGAFIAFHGSWNRAPLPQQGFRVVFLPLTGGKAGAHRDFATDFSNAGGPGKDGKLHRPTGLAQGSDGSLYVSDDRGGTIYKISYKGK